MSSTNFDSLIPNLTETSRKYCKIFSKIEGKSIVWGVKKIGNGEYQIKFWHNLEEKRWILKNKSIKKYFLIIDYKRFEIEFEKIQMVSSVNIFFRNENSIPIVNDYLKDLKIKKKNNVIIHKIRIQY